MKPYLQVEDLTKSYGDRMLFDSITFGVNEGDKIGVIAKNGTGKSTLLRLLSGHESPDSGAITFRNDLRVGFLDQSPIFEPGTTLMSNLLPAIHENDHEEWNREDRVRQMLSQLGIDDAELIVDHLSGGQIKRAALARVLLGAPDLLILDEPTNHLDIMSKEILEDAINDYEGTVLYVSHDRYFINRTAHRILELSGQALTGYLGNYDYYLEKKTENTAANIRKTSGASGGTDTSAISSAKADWQAKKAAQAKQRKLENDLKKAETRIAELEQKIADIDTLMSSDEVCRNSAKLGELSAEQEKIREELDALYEEWERLSEMA